MLGKKHSQESKAKMSVSQKGRARSEETKTKISAGLKNSKPFLDYQKSRAGSKLPEETKDKIRAAGIGRIASDESRRKNSLSKLGNKFSLGVKRSEEFKKHISETRSGTNNHWYGTKGPNFGKKFSEESRQRMSVAQCKAILNNGGAIHSLQKHIKGKFYSNKNKMEIRYDSCLELRAFKLLEKDKSVLGYSRCDFYVPYILTDNIHRYIPDIKILLVDGKIMIVEIKPDFRLAELINVTKFKFASAFCESKGWSFVVWAETYIKEREQ